VAGFSAALDLFIVKVIIVSSMVTRTSEKCSRRARTLSLCNCVVVRMPVQKCIAVFRRIQWSMHRGGLGGSNPIPHTEKFIVSQTVA